MAEGRERALFAAGAALLVGGAAVAYLVLLGPSPAGSPPPRAAGPAVEQLAVARVQGPVRIRRGGAGGPLLEARPGDELRSEDVVETGSGSVQLAAGERYRVDLDPASFFTVKEITDQLARFRLASGLASASVRDDPGRAFEIEAGGGARARTRGGDLTVSSSERVAAVAVTRGEAELASGGRVVVVRAGRQALAVDGGVPSEPEPIPSSLLLKVVWPEVRATNRRRLVVSGRAAPGAALALEGQPVAVQPDGTFRQVVYLREGRQTLTIQGKDVGGHRAQARSPEILLDTHGAPAEFETEGLWEDRRR